MPLSLDGATRVHYIVGDPIAQVKSPGGVSACLQDRGHNAVVLPAHVSPTDLAAWVAGVSLAQNVDGIIVTVPHKFACRALCRSVSERSAFVGSVNTMRRNADGSWHGDMFDGLAFVQALRDQGAPIAGQRALLAGAGGAGSAIAQALVLAGVAELAITDADAARQQALVGQLAALNLGRVRAGTADPRGFDLVLNATPMGMGSGDPLPFDVAGLHAGMTVGCVITQPAISPLVAEARARGCKTSTGSQMFAHVRDLMVDFLLEKT